MFIKRIIGLLFILVLTGCALPQAEIQPTAIPETSAPLIEVHPAQPTVTETSPAPSATPTPTCAAVAATVTISPSPYPPTPTPLPDLDEAALQVATLTLPETGPITLQDGYYAQGETRVSLLTWAKGWLVYNGGIDAVAAVSLNTGGTGNFVYLVAFYNEQGTAMQHGDAIFVGDRVQINELSIWDGRIMLDAVTHWQDEPFCCPSKHVRLTYKNTSWGWRLERMATFMPAGAVHQVSFLRVGPLEGSRLQIYGLVSTLPAENTLVYRWRAAEDTGGAILEQGTITVIPDDTGSAGHFEAAIPLPAVPPNFDAVLQIVEISLRDGSVLAQDSAWVTLE